MSIDLAFNVAPGLLGGDLFFSTSAIMITPGTGAELVTNGGMESENPPANWTNTTPSLLAMSAASDERTGGAGSKSLALVFQNTGAGNNFGIASQTVAVTAGTFYVLSLWVKKVLGASVGYNATGASNGAGQGYFTNTSWAQKLATFRATGSTFEVKPTIFQSGVGDGNEGRVDDVSLQALSNTEQLFTHALAYGTFSMAFTSAAASCQAGLVFNVQDASNFSRLYFDRVDGKVYLTQRIAGTVTTIGSWSATYAAGTPLSVTRHKDGTLDVHYGATTLASGLAATGLAGLQAGPFLTDAAGVTISNYRWDARSIT